MTQPSQQPDTVNAGSAAFVSTSKERQRARLQHLRGEMSTPARHRKSDRACLLAAASFSQFECIAAYSAISSELSPTHLIDELRCRRVQVAFPRVCKTTRILEFCLVSNEEDLSLGTYGILEPRPELRSIPLSTIDAFLVPALGFSPQGKRLGWGRGYYDQTLAQCPLALRVGICFQEQIVASLPTTSTDEPMDLIVTDTKLYRPGLRSRDLPRNHQ